MSDHKQDCICVKCEGERAALARPAMPRIETFTGHSHTLREDIEWFYDLFVRGGINARSEWVSAALYNLCKAVEFCEKQGVMTFADNQPKGGDDE